MVWEVNFRVYLAVVGGEVRWAQNVVNTDPKSFLIIWQTDTSAGGDETVGKSFGHGVVSVGNRGVVEVATDNDGVLPVRFNILMDGFHLFGADGGIFA